MLLLKFQVFISLCTGNLLQSPISNLTLAQTYFPTLFCNISLNGVTPDNKPFLKKAMYFLSGSYVFVHIILLNLYFVFSAIEVLLILRIHFECYFFMKLSILLHFH